MRTTTTIYDDTRKASITTLDGSLMPPVGTSIAVGNHWFTVAELPEVTILLRDLSVDRYENEVSIILTVKES